MTHQASAAGGFVAGTQVQLNYGSSQRRKAIEHIEVGDLVLAMPENGIGAPAGKRVINTFEFEQKPIW